MTTTLWRYRRAVTNAWLMRSQPASPMYDSVLADRLLARHTETIRADLSRMRLDIEPAFINKETFDVGETIETCTSVS